MNSPICNPTVLANHSQTIYTSPVLGGTGATACHPARRKSAAPRPATRDGDQPAHAVAIAPPPGDGAGRQPAPIPSQEDLIADLYGRQKSILDYLQKHNGDLAFEHRIAAETLYTKNASTLSRMIRNVGTGDRRLTDALNVALDAMAQELGI